MVKRVKKRIKKTLKTPSVKILFVLCVVFVGIIFLWIGTLKIPDLDTFEERRVSQSIKLYDRTGEILLYDFNDDLRRVVVSYDEISRHAKNASVAIEDAEFYEHKGIRFLATLRAVFLQPLKGKGVQGGSTITQQVVKNSLLTSERKISRKLKEWVLSLKIEKILTKEEILALYLNEAPYGGSIYGVEEASQVFFGVSASDLSLSQAAYLAALPQAPTYYSPYGNNVAELEKRKNLVLKKMFENGFITKEEYNESFSEKVVFLPRSTVGIRAPHFVFFIEEYLEDLYGVHSLKETGLKVITTIDYSLQEKAEEIVKKYALENEEKFNAENASLVAVDPKTGQILVMVGSRDYFDENIDGNFNVALAHRQPGSAFKPFVYATAFKKGFTPETVVFDLKTEFSTTCSFDGQPLYPSSVCYMPGNYDNIFRGPVSFRNALAQSINIPAIKVLYLSGLEDSLRTARDMGIRSLTNIAQYGLTLVLGGGEVSLLDITSAYGVFANEGIRNEQTGILRIENSEGEVLKEFQPQGKRVLDESVALTVSDVLSDNVARTPAFGARSVLYFPEHEDVAVKTGTTNDYRDAWVIGYTPEIAVGAWAGNNDNSSMEKRVAGFIIAPLWNEFMKEVLETRQNSTFRSPSTLTKQDLRPVLRGVWDGGETYVIDKISGLLATEYTPTQTKEEKVVKSVHTILRWIDKRNPLGVAPENPSEDSQYGRWEYSVRNWVNSNNIFEEDSSVIPKDFDNIHVPSSFPILSFSNIKNSYKNNERISFSVTNSSKYQLQETELYINNRFVGSTKSYPAQFSFIPNEVDGIKKTNTIRVVSYDSVFNQGSKDFVFSIE